MGSLASRSLVCTPGLRASPQTERGSLSPRERGKLLGQPELCVSGGACSSTCILGPDHLGSILGLPPASQVICSQVLRPSVPQFPIVLVSVLSSQGCEN